MRRNTATRRLQRAIEIFERSEYQFDHAGLLSELGDELTELAAKIERVIENRLEGDGNEQTARELGE